MADPMRERSSTSSPRGFLVSRVLTPLIAIVGACGSPSGGGRGRLRWKRRRSGWRRRRRGRRRSRNGRRAGRAAVRTDGAGLGRGSGRRGSGRWRRRRRGARGRRNGRWRPGRRCGWGGRHRRRWKRRGRRAWWGGGAARAGSGGAAGGGAGTAGGAAMLPGVGGRRDGDVAGGHAGPSRRRARPRRRSKSRAAAGSRRGFAVTSARYERMVTVPNLGRPQATYLEFGAVNHQAALSVDGTAVATNTTSFTPSVFDVTRAPCAPGASPAVHRRRQRPRRAPLVARQRSWCPTPPGWSANIPQGIFRSAVRARGAGAARLRRVRPHRRRGRQDQRRRLGDATTAPRPRTARSSVALSSWNCDPFTYPTLPGVPVSVPAGMTVKVTVGPVTWGLGPSSYWWPNVPYVAGLPGPSPHRARDGHARRRRRWCRRRPRAAGAFRLPADPPGRRALRAQRRARELPRRQPAGRQLRQHQDREGRVGRVRPPPGLPAAVGRQRRLAGRRRQLPAPQLQREPHPPGARQPVHARRGGRAGAS